MTGPTAAARGEQMHSLIVGAAGMIGRKLSQRLASDAMSGAGDLALTLVDVVAPDRPETFDGATRAIVADLSSPGVADEIIATRPDTIFHLAAIVSGEAEADFERGYRINLDGTRLLLEAIRQQGLKQPYCPRVVFTSSIAVFGRPFADTISDDFLLAPLTSYGTQKAIGELLLADYTRRGVLDGIGIRLPTICVRPGKPNRAASGFFSGILREPLQGHEAILPVAATVRHWFASPRAAIGFLTHAATMELSQLGARRNITMPGLSATVEEQVEALRRVAGDKAVALIRRQHDPAIASIVANWPCDFAATRATELGFTAERSMEEIIRIYIEDELGGRIAG